MICQKKKKKSAQPESNQRPRDINCKQLQSPALPTELYADTIIKPRVNSKYEQTKKKENTIKNKEKSYFKKKQKVHPVGIEPTPTKLTRT